MEEKSKGEKGGMGKEGWREETLRKEKERQRKGEGKRKVSKNRKRKIKMGGKGANRSETLSLLADVSS